MKRAFVVILSLFVYVPLDISFVLTSYKIRSANALLSSNINTRFDNTQPTPKNYNGNIKDKFKSAILIGSGIVVSQLSPLLSATALTEGPVVIIGSSGKTGKLIVEQLKGLKVPYVATYRGLDPKERSAYSAYADVTKLETLEPVVKGASAVIFAASASNRGGNAGQVDNIGVANIAKECVRLKVPRLVVISSGALTRPDSLAFKFTNLFGGILDEKLKGENALREAYASAGDTSLSYVIIRPGGLADYEAEGPAKIELNQGDSISGEVSRADVAQCTVAAALSKTIPPNVTFEIYEASRAGPLQGTFSQKSGYERRGQTYDEMFSGLKSGVVTI